MQRSSHPKRIVCLDPGLTEILFALGLERRIAGLAEGCDYPMGARGKERMGPAESPDCGALMALQSDLVLARLPAQRAAVKQLVDAGAGVRALEPLSLEDVCNAILDLGAWTGREADAYRIVTGIRSPLNRMREARRGKPSLRVYAEESSCPPVAAGGWVGGLLRICGAEPFLASGEPSRAVSAEELAAFDPGLMVFARGEGQEFQPDNPAAREGWGELRAVREGRIRYVPRELLLRPGPRLVEGARRLARLLDELA